jgi:hypothetical protein
MDVSTGNGPLATIYYQPGVCNIGPAEIARRRRSGHAGLVAAIVILALLVVLHAPAWTRLLLFVPAGGSAAGYLQARLHFCAGFGSAGIYNFGELGKVDKVTDHAERTRDLLRSVQIGLASLAIGLAVGIAAYLLPAV